MARIENSKKNLVFNTIQFASKIIMQFILRTVIIYVLGIEYIGLNGLFSNIFAFLNLAELGIGSAIVYSMYKPVAEGDVEKIKSLQNTYKRCYLIISLIVLGVGLLLLPFIKILIKGDVSVRINIYLLYLMYLINTVFGYFSAHKRSLLFAYQRNDVESEIKIACLTLMTIIQIVVLFLTKNYYYFFLVNVLFTLLECVLVSVWAKKMYPDITGRAKKLDKQTRSELSKNITALCAHKIGRTIVFSTDNILISVLIGLNILGMYSNYYLIISALITFFTIIKKSISGSVGNLVVCKDTEYCYVKFKQINMIFILFSSFTTICLFTLFQPFMKVWLGEDFLLDNLTVLLMCISFYLSRMRTGILVFRDAAGLFLYDRWKPIAEVLVNLVVSIILGLHIGLIGIIIGTIISTIVAPLWVEPLVVYKHYFKRSVKEYFIRYLIDFVIMLVVAVITYFICSFIPDGGIFLFLAKMAVCVILSASLLVLIYCRTKEFKDIIKIIKQIFVKKSINEVNKKVK